MKAKRRRMPAVFVRVEVGRRYWETGYIRDETTRDDPPTQLGYPMQVYAPPVGFIHPEDER